MLFILKIILHFSKTSSIIKKQWGYVMIKALIFDFDGVICDTEFYYAQRKVAFCAKLGLELTVDQIKPYVGQSFTVVFPLLFPDYPNPEKVIEKYYEDFMYHVPDYDVIFNSELYVVLEYCKNKNIKVAIASNSKHTRLVRECVNLKLLPYLSKLVSSEALEISKPDPMFYTKTLEFLNVEASQAMIVEDSVHGIHAAKGAGVFTIAKRESHFNVDQSQADVIVDRLDEIINIIEKKALSA